MLDFITWTADPAIFTIGSREIRWYGLAFAVGFAIGYMIVERMWKRERLPQAWIDSLLIYTMLGTVIGARLGHCLFYAPDYYLANPVEILKIWEGGLASHGGTLGIIVAIYFYSRKVSHKSMLWTFDKLVVPTGLVAAMIRLGNLMNHEIYGHATDLPWGFRFIENLHAWKRGAEPIFSAPSHPTQLYEAACYLIIFGVCMWLYFKKEKVVRIDKLDKNFFVTTSKDKYQTRSVVLAIGTKENKLSLSFIVGANTSVGLFSFINSFNFLSKKIYLKTRNSILTFGTGNGFL